MYKKLLIALVALSATTVCYAGNGRDAGAKMRGEFGGMSSRMAPRMYYYRPAPMVVQAAPRQAAPPAVAQQPTQRRSFSVEPATPPAPAAAPAPAATPAPMYYQAPRGSYRPSQPSYMHPKTDPRRYGRAG